MDPARRTFFFQGLELTYYSFEAVPSSRPAVIFCHATGFSALTYRPLLARLAERGFSVHALDFAGHGASALSSDFDDWYFFRDQVLALVDHLDLKRAVGVGHSLGGASVLLAAAGDERRRFEALVGLDPVVLTPLRSLFLGLQKRFHPLAQAAEKRRETMPSREVLERSYRRSPTFEGWDETCFQGYLDSGFTKQADGSLRLNLPGAVEAKVFRSQNPGHWYWYRRLRAPLFIYKMNGSFVTPEHGAKLLAKRHPRSRRMSHASGSHFFPMIEPVETADHLADFFDEVAAP